MKSAAIIFVVGIFLLGVGYYLVRTNSPFDKSKLEILIQEKNIISGDWEKLDDEIGKVADTEAVLQMLSREFYVTLIVLYISLTCIFASVHMVVDKVFFKEFYKKPSVVSAFRRGVLFMSGAILIWLVRLYRLETYYFVIIPAIIILFEIVVAQFFGHGVVKAITQINEKINQQEIDNQK